MLRHEQAALSRWGRTNVLMANFLALSEQACSPSPVACRNRDSAKLVARSLWLVGNVRDMARGLWLVACGENQTPRNTQPSTQRSLTQ